jgi:hypothetical protein
MPTVIDTDLIGQDGQVIHPAIGPAASDAPESGNPVQIGISVDETAPAAAAEGDVRRWRGSAEGDGMVQQAFEGAAVVNANGIFVQGPVASDGVAAGNPVQIGGVVDDTTPAAAAEGDIRALRASPEGNIYTEIISGTSAAKIDTGDSDERSVSDKSLFTTSFLYGLAPDGQWNRARTLGNTAGAGLGVLATAPWIPGASDVTSRRVSIGGTSETAAEVIPSSGTSKKIRIISVGVMSAANSTDPSRIEVYFGTGANITTNAGKEVAEMYTGTSGADREVWPDGGGPVGIANEILSWRTSAETETALSIIVHYREE